MNTTSDILEEVRALNGAINWRPVKTGSVLLILAGAVAFAGGLTGPDPERIWQAYLTNFVFWLGMASGSLLLSAILVITNSRWGRPVKRLAEAPAAFLPVAFVLFWAIYFGREHVFPWLHEPLVPPKALYLNIPFLFIRDGAALFILAALAVALLHSSVQADRELLESGQRYTAPAAFPENGVRFRRQNLLAPAYVLLFAFFLTLIAWDLIMTLDPEWVSTLFGAYYFIGSFYTGLGAIIILTALAIKKMGLGRFIGQRQLHDLGKLLLAFCVLMTDFFYVQFLVIWYGNMPEETRYVIKRVRFVPWDYLSWTVLIVCFVAPFLILLLRKIKMKPGAMTALAAFVLVGMWLERFLLVAPSIWSKNWMPLGLTEVLITGGFLGLMGLSVALFLERYPLVPVSDPLFWAALEQGQTITTPAE
jgi:Ni/Fe-hydrogenase subunit HybB-like protein